MMWHAIRARVPALSRRTRSFSEQSDVFDRAAKLRQRARALAAPDAADFDYLREAVAERVVGRLRDVARSTLADALDLGCHTGHLRRALEDDAGVDLSLIHI